MNIPNPPQLKIYHILHIDKLKSVIETGGLVSDSEVMKSDVTGTTIGMDKIKSRRFSLPVKSHQGLMVGECVPFYFSPRSVMLYIFHRDNHPEIDYHGGQEPIIHLMVDLYKTVEWANGNCKKWAFTTSNAGSLYFNDYSDLNKLSKIKWNIVRTTNWTGHQDEKQAEFLVEKNFPWHLVEGIGVYSDEYLHKVNAIINDTAHKPIVKTKREWYY